MTLLVVAVAALLVPGPVMSIRPPLGAVKGVPGLHSNDRDLLSKCNRHWFHARLDHYSAAKPDGGHTTFKQRYFVCDTVGWKKGGPIFFYVGNEADVTLYLNATGLMWESAAEFGALLMFAEHRYYGESKPFAEKDIRDHMQYLTAEQALADYADLITFLKHDRNSTDSAVIGFGGSYGGMLASWFRMKSPNVLDGAIASSAPIWSFYDLDPPYNDKSFAQVVTRDASEAGGSAPACADNLRKGWASLFALGKHSGGQKTIASAMNLCHGVPLKNDSHVTALAQWLQEAWDYMAMGNFPYESLYILNGLGVLPAYPVRVACEALAEEGLQGRALLAGLAQAASVFYNYSGQLDCLDYRKGVNNATSEDGEFWSYQSCTGQAMPFSRDGVDDAFWEQPNDAKQNSKDCRQQWNVTPQIHWPAIHWLGRDISSASNMVFANGLLDPWSGGGVLEDVNESIKAIIIPEGAHHLDLFFSHPKDPESVKVARDQQRSEMHKWVAQKAQRVAAKAAKSALRAVTTA